MDLLEEIKKKFPLISFFNDKLEDWNVVTNKSENYKQINVDLSNN